VLEQSHRELGGIIKGKMKNRYIKKKANRRKRSKVVYSFLFDGKC
jgi:hypothetical protein